MARVSPLVVAFLLLALASQLAAHPGRTDASGGHFNRKTGEYHYHNGGRSSAPAAAPIALAPRSWAPAAAPPVTSPAPDPERINWHDTEGRLITYGHLVAAYDRIGWQVWIKKRNGSTVNVKLSDLSAADRAYALVGHKQHDFKRTRRTWTSAKGMFTVSGKALLIDSDAVRLRRQHDKRVITVPLSKLCEDDRDYVGRLIVASEPPRPNAVGGNPFVGTDEPPGPALPIATPVAGREYTK